MKKIVAALLLITVANASQAAIDEKTCLVVKEIAEATMSARQTGVDVVDMINLANETGGKLGTLSKALAIDAYKMPSYSTKEFKDREIAEFGTRHYLNCIKNIK